MIDRMRSDLINRAKGGDGTAFGALVDPRLDGLIRLASAIVGNESDARDAVQETLSIAWRELRSLRQDDRFDPWVSRILINECRRIIRMQKRLQRRESAIPEDAAFATSSMVEDRVAGRDLIVRALDRRPRQTRAAGAPLPEPSFDRRDRRDPRHPARNGQVPTPRCTSASQEGNGRGGT